MTAIDRGISTMSNPDYWWGSLPPQARGWPVPSLRPAHLTGGTMKQIPLSKGKFALVDDADFAWLSQWKWHVTALGYAARNSKSIKGRKETIRMHRLIAGTPAGMDTDHRDGDKLNNQRFNLRIATRTENGRNRKPKKGSEFKGVYLFKKSGKWRAQIRVDRKLKELGLFILKEDAAKAYNAAAIEHFGGFARLNEV